MNKRKEILISSFSFIFFYKNIRDGIYLDLTEVKSICNLSEKTKLEKESLKYVTIRI